MNELQDDEDILNDKEEEIQKFLGHCICGQPGASLRFLHKVLNELNKEYDEKKLDRLSKIFHNDYGIQYTIYYMLDKYGLTEHGGSVPGYIDGDGFELLEKLDELYGKIEDKSDDI